MKYVLTSSNSIKVGNENIHFPSSTFIDKVESFNEVVCLKTTPLETDLDWGKLETHQIWKERCLANPSQLFCYDFTGKLKWKLPYDNVVGFGQIFPEQKKETNFITPEHYKKYTEKYKGKELLEVYADSFRFVVDANTGEIYDKMESR
jgi:hypothetical protein